MTKEERRMFIAGMYSMRSCFQNYWSVIKNRSGEKCIYPLWKVSLETGDLDQSLLKMVRRELGIGSVTVNKGRTRFIIASKDQLKGVFIPYLDGLLVGVKKFEFEVWKRSLLEYLAMSEVEKYRLRVVKESELLG